MKRSLAALLLALAVLLGLLPTALAAEPTTVVVLKIDCNKMAVNTAVSLVDEQNAAVRPVAENNRTLVPVSRIVAAFGGSSSWVRATNGTTFTLGERRVTHIIGSNTVTVYRNAADPGETRTMEVSSKAMNDRTYMPARYVLEGLGITVGYEPTQQLVIAADGEVDQSDLLSLPGARALLAALQPAPAGDPISVVSGKTFSLPSGQVTASVVTVDMTDPRVSVRAALPQGRLNTTAPFGDICAAAQARVVANANFFNSYDTIRDPVGHVMVDGEFALGTSGITAVAFTEDNQVRFGVPAVFYRVETADDGPYQKWAAFDVNDYRNGPYSITIYTPVWGSSILIQNPGSVLAVVNDVTASYVPVAANETVSIPENGYIIYFCQGETETDWFYVPQLGRRLTVTPYLTREDGEGFSLDGVTTIISGAPRLIKKGQVVTTVTEPGFAGEARFGDTYSGPRTAIGVTADRKLILVNAPAATIPQLRELMAALKCVDAVNLDGGASTALWVDGQTIDPAGRELATTIQIFTDRR